MKKIFFLSLILLISRISFSQADVKTIIQKYINAIGGETKLKEVKDLTMNMEGEVQGQSISLNMQKKLPNMFLTEINVLGMGTINKTVFDGTKGFVSAMGQEQVIEGENAKALKSQSEIFGEMLYFENIDNVIYLGEEDFEGKKCHKLSIKANGAEVIEYYETESGLKKKQTVQAETPMGTTKMDIIYNDYKAVNGILFPHTMKQDMGLVTFELKLTNILLNQNLSNDIFLIK